MSPRARRVVDGAATRYDWGGGAADSFGVTPAAASAAPVVAPEDAAQHQAALAALEREAFATGYAQGERAGLEAGNTRAEAMLRRLASTLDELTTLRQTMIQQSERQLVELSLAIARRILRREVTLDGDLIIAMAHVALERLGDAGSATIRLNPDDYAHTVQRHGEQWAGSRVRVLADPAVGRGGCQVESEFGYVDAGVEAQFDQVMRALVGDRGEIRHVRPAA
jgi:flagellar assembly protein FliH